MLSFIVALGACVYVTLAINYMYKLINIHKTNIIDLRARMVVLENRLNALVMPAAIVDETKYI